MLGALVSGEHWLEDVLGQLHHKTLAYVDGEAVV
jgi:hypothetical protein